MGPDRTAVAFDTSTPQILAMDIGVAVVGALRRSESLAIELAQAAEELHCHSLWAGENVIGPVSLKRSRYPQSADGQPHWDHLEQWPDAMVTLAFLAGATSRIRLGTSVVAGATRHPLFLAKQAATLDVVSAGRLELGLGAGWAVEQAIMLDQQYDHPNGRLSETIEILRAAWGSPSFEHRGRFWSFDEVGVHPQPVQGATMPIWIGGRSERAVRMAAEQGDGSLLSSRRLDFVSSVRQRLPEGKRVGAMVRLGGDLPADATLLQAVRDDGADLLILQLPDDGKEVARLEQLAARILPEL